MGADTLSGVVAPDAELIKDLIVIIITDEPLPIDFHANPAADGPIALLTPSTPMSVSMARALSAAALLVVCFLSGSKRRIQRA